MPENYDDVEGLLGIPGEELGMEEFDVTDGDLSEIGGGEVDFIEVGGDTDRLQIMDAAGLPFINFDDVAAVAPVVVPVAAPVADSPVVGGSCVRLTPRERRRARAEAKTKARLKAEAEARAKAEAEFGVKTDMNFTGHDAPTKRPESKTLPAGAQLPSEALLVSDVDVSAVPVTGGKHTTEIFNAEVLAFKLQIAELNSWNNELLGNLDKARVKVEELEGELRKANDHIIELESKLGVAKQESVSAEARIRELTDYERFASNRINILAADLLESDRDLAAARDTIEELRKNK